MNDAKLEFREIRAVAVNGGTTCLPRMFRARVPDGWLVLLHRDDPDETTGFFYLDPEHRWERG